MTGALDQGKHGFRLYRTSPRVQLCTHASLTAFLSFEYMPLLFICKSSMSVDAKHCLLFPCSVYLFPGGAVPITHVTLSSLFNFSIPPTIVLLKIHRLIVELVNITLYNRTSSCFDKSFYNVFNPPIAQTPCPIA